MPIALKQFKQLPVCYKAACLSTTIISVGLFSITAYLELTKSWTNPAIAFLTVLALLGAVKFSVLSWGYANQYLKLQACRRGRAV